MEGGRNNSRLPSWGHPSMTVAVAAVSLLGSTRSAPLGMSEGQGRAEREGGLRRLAAAVCCFDQDG